MGRGKDDFIKRYGGLRANEGPSEMKARLDEIDELERKFRSGTVGFTEIEKIQRRLCELKGIDWDDDSDGF